MALDFHRRDTNEYLFGLDDKQLIHLSTIFELFKKATNIAITPYDDVELSVENQTIMIKIIDAYIKQTDLNVNKVQTSTIIEFKGLLKYLVGKNININLFCD